MAPIFTGFRFGFGGSVGGDISNWVGGFLASAAGPGSGTGYYEVLLDGAGTTGTSFTYANVYLWATSNTVAVQWLTNHGFVVNSPSNARQVTTSRTNFTINASSVPSAAKVIAYGAGGGHAAATSQPVPGDANVVASEGGTIHVTSGFVPGQYKVVIGQGGYQSTTVGWNLGGYGGGGDGRQNRGENHGGGGGGLTGLYQPGWPGAFNVPEAVTNAYIVASGGGGSGYSTGMVQPTPYNYNNTRRSNGGSGGYPIGDDGSWYGPTDTGGRGGSQSAAGDGGPGRSGAGDDGSFSKGGDGSNTTAGASGEASGGGGGGYYGGGGGGSIVGAGGGGSSFAPAPSTKTGYYGWNPVGGWGINGKGTVRGVQGNADKFGSTQYNDPDSQGAGGLLYIYV